VPVPPPESLSVPMPGALYFEDKDGNKRTEIRIKCWEDPFKMIYKSISILPMEELTEHPVPDAKLKFMDFYRGNDKKVFLGITGCKANPCYSKTISATWTILLKKKENWWPTDLMGKAF
tara:strand:+ start:431 stop:787 length:357 start_codon:yes stop_codon:yes gene_type:complete